jgi:hypothetical protein
VEIVLPPDVGAALSFVDFSRGTFWGDVLVTRIAAPAAIPPLAFGRFASFQKPGAGAVTVTTAAGIVLTLDIRGCNFIQASLAAAGLNASIDRSTHFLFVAGPLLIGPNPIAIAPPMPANAGGPNGYQVSATPNTAAAIAASITGKLGGGFTLNAAAAGGGYDLLVSRAE